MFWFIAHAHVVLMELMCVCFRDVCVCVLYSEFDTVPVRNDIRAWRCDVGDSRDKKSFETERATKRLGPFVSTDTLSSVATLFVVEQ